MAYAFSDYEYASQRPATNCDIGRAYAERRFILDRYELVVSENALLKKENEELKLSRGNPINDTTYPINKKIGSHIAAEPGAHKHT